MDPIVVQPYVCDMSYDDVFLLQWCYELTHDECWYRPCRQIHNGKEYFCKRCQDIIDKWLIETENTPSTELPITHPRYTKF
jgi:hypothetical protein